MTRAGCFNLKTTKRSFLLGLTLLLAGGLVFFRAPVSAQSGGSATVTQPDISHFPTVSFYLDAHDPAGNFLTGLHSSDLQVLENDLPRPVTTLTTIQPGIQMTVALNIAPIMANRSTTESVYQKIQTALQTWASAQPATSPDDFTLLSNEGMQTIHQTDPQRWVKALAAYQPDLLHSQPSLSSLSQAVDIATDPNPGPNMSRAVLYITPLPADNSLSALPNLAERALQMGIHVSVWLVAPAASQDTKGADALRQMATRTGGQFFLLTGAEAAPDPEISFKPLRDLYQVTYTSGIQKSGGQRLAAQVTWLGRKLVSPEQDFKLTVQPPNPMFLEPPSQIQRDTTQVSGQSTLAAQPEVYALKILIEFPDGHPRPLRTAQLYVDGAVAAERTAEPFDQFDWNLANYQASQRHTLKVTVTDTLGLSQSSIEIPVEVLVTQPKINWFKENVSPQRLKIGGSILLAGIALGLVLWISGRKGWFTSAERRRRAHLMKDPVTQPVKIQQDQPRKNTPAAEEHPSWPRPGPARKAPASLVRVDENNQAISNVVIPISRREITVGSNPQQASCVINYPTVEGLHARLTVTADNIYMLSDAGSVAGTWINYSPVSSVGSRLEHGDLVHFGQVAFRFELANPPHILQPQVSKYEEPL